MNSQTWGFSISFLIHTAVVVSLLSMSHLFNIQKPVVIDFSIEGGTQESGAGGQQSQKSEDQPQPVKPLARKRAAVQEKPAESPVPLAETKEQHQEDSPVSVPVQEEPVQTTTLAANTEASATSPLPMGADNGADAAPFSPKGGPGTGSSPGPGKDGKALEKAKNLYLKEHFAYIRDTIMKNVAYPYIARKRGLTGKVVVSFIVCEKGFANNIKIVERSGYSILDNNAIETIKKASPFPRPPVRAEIVMPIVYKIM